MKDMVLDMSLVNKILGINCLFVLSIMQVIFCLLLVFTVGRLFNIYLVLLF